MFSREDLLYDQIDTGYNPAFMKCHKTESELFSSIFVVGIGGTGIAAIRRTAKRMKQDMPDYSKHVFFLAIDRDPTELDSLDELRAPSLRPFRLIPDSLEFLHLPHDMQEQMLSNNAEQIRAEIRSFSDMFFSMDPQRRVEIMLISGAAGYTGSTFFDRTAGIIRSVFEGRDAKLYSFLSLLDSSDPKMHHNPAVADLFRNRQREVLRKIAAQPELFGSLTFFHENHTGIDFSAHTLENFIFSAAAFTHGTLLPGVFYSELTNACAMRTGTPLANPILLFGDDPEFSEYRYALLTCTEFTIPEKVTTACILKEIAEKISRPENELSFPADISAYDAALADLLGEKNGSLVEKTKHLLHQCMNELPRLPHIEMPREEFFGGGWAQIREMYMQHLRNISGAIELILHKHILEMLYQIRTAVPDILHRYGFHAFEYLYRERPAHLETGYKEDTELERLRDHIISRSIHQQTGETLAWLHEIAAQGGNIEFPAPPEAIPLFRRITLGNQIMAEWLDQAERVIRRKFLTHAAECALKMCRDLYFSEMERIYESCRTFSYAADMMLEAYRGIDPHMLAEFSLDNKWSQPCIANACCDPAVRQWTQTRVSGIASSAQPEEFRDAFLYMYESELERCSGRLPSGRELRELFDEILSRTCRLGMYDGPEGITFARWFEETMDNAPVGMQNSVLSGIAALIFRSVKEQERHLSISESPYRERVLLLPEALGNGPYAVNLTNLLQQALGPVLIGTQSGSDSILCYTLSEGIAIAELPDM